jgi:hypothetical protein
MGALLQMFPSHLWSSTTLGRATRATRAPSPGVPNSGLIISRTWRGAVAKDAVALPIATLEPAELAEWSRMVMAKRGTWNPAVVLRPRAASSAKPATGSPQQRIDNFRNRHAGRFRPAVLLFRGTPHSSLNAGWLTASDANLGVTGARNFGR